MSQVQGKEAQGKEAQAVEIVKWAVGPAGCPAPTIESLDEEALTELATYHRIEARLLARLESARPAWCPARLLTRLRIRQHGIRRQASVQMQAAREMSQAMKERGLQPPIVVKGFAAYALTANPEGLHFSGDLDTFAEDKPAFWDVLHQIGYTGKRKDTYEWAKLRRQGITLDIHRHFPMLAYPPEVRALPAARLEARRNPGNWPLPAPASGLASSAEPLRWEDLIPDAAWGAAQGTEDILFPSPTLLCLIHCSHCFRSLITRLHYMDPQGDFRLYELLVIADLARLPGFDPAQFTALVDRFAAQDSVCLVNTLAAAFLGAKALPEPEGPAEETFPEHLIYGGWVSLQQTEDWLRPRGISEMIHQLGANVVPAVCRLDVRDVLRLLTQGTAPPLFQIGLFWDAAQKSVVLDWTFPDMPADRAEHELLVHFGYGSVIKVHLDCDWGVRAVVQKSDYGLMDARAAAETVSAGDCPAVRVACSVPIWPDAPTAPTESLPLFLAVCRLDSSGQSSGQSMKAASYLPLRLLQSEMSADDSPAR